jgi:hypothetical protein
MQSAMSVGGETIKTPDEVDMAIEQFLRNERGCVP